MDAIQRWVRRILSRPTNAGTIFQQLQDEFDTIGIGVNPGVATDIKAIKKNLNRERGLLFEVLTKELIKLGAFSGIKASEVYLFNELTDELRTTLAVGTVDRGIDLVVKTVDDKWYAVQCKYRKRPRPGQTVLIGGNKYPKKHTVTWRDLSTFYSLATRTGPKPGGWDKYVVITNAESVSWYGRKTAWDLSVCKGSFGGIGREIWLGVSGDRGHTLAEPSSPTSNETVDDTPQPLTPEQLRQKRLERFMK